jgi:hypothetical protein
VISSTVPSCFLHPDLVADDEGATPENQDASEEILEHILEREADGDRRDAETGDGVSRLERREDNDRRDEETKHGQEERGEPP